jgi:hypothetical protein
MRLQRINPLWWGCLGSNWSYRIRDLQLLSGHAADPLGRR